MTSLRRLLLVPFTLALTCRAAEPLPDPKAPPAQVFSIECQMVTVPAKIVPALVPELNDETKAVAAWEKVLAMLGRGEATLTGHLVSKVVAQQKVVSESIEEVRYATEYQPPQLPSTTPTQPSVEVLKNWPHVGIIPTAFETRNTGQTIEIELGPTADPKVIICNFVIQHVRFEKFVKYDAGRLANGDKLFVEQPYFSVMKDQSQAPLELGKPKLIGVHRLPGAEGLFELFVLKVQTSAQAH